MHVYTKLYSRSVLQRLALETSPFLYNPLSTHTSHSHAHTLQLPQTHTVYFPDELATKRLARPPVCPRYIHATSRNYHRRYTIHDTQNAHKLFSTAKTATQTSRTSRYPDTTHTYIALIYTYVESMCPSEADLVSTLRQSPPAHAQRACTVTVSRKRALRPVRALCTAQLFLFADCRTRRASS